MELASGDEPEMLTDTCPNTFKVMRARMHAKAILLR
jgi:hypothetical protein